jgi:hypothetical protein
MKTQRNVLSIVVAFGLWLGLVVGCSSGNKTSDEPIKITAEDLYKAYETNQAGADELYKGKTLIVSGAVGSVYVLEDKEYVNLFDARQKLIVECAGFAANQKDAISKLKAGQRVSVRGYCVGRVLGYPVLEDCVLQ